MYRYAIAQMTIIDLVALRCIPRDLDVFLGNRTIVPTRHITQQLELTATQVFCLVKQQYFCMKSNTWIH
jgi:hypothetical protein